MPNINDDPALPWQNGNRLDDYRGGCREPELVGSSGPDGLPLLRDADTLYLCNLHR
jgi:hypothetical protein